MEFTFQHSMEKSALDKIPAKRMKNIIVYLTYDTFRYVSRGFFEKHKLLYALLIALKVNSVIQRMTLETGNIRF
jgi:dynein heavy chain